MVLLRPGHVFVAQLGVLVPGQLHLASPLVAKHVDLTQAPQGTSATAGEETGECAGAAGQTSRTGKLSVRTAGLIA